MSKAICIVCGWPNPAPCELTTLIGELHGQPLNRDRPLWDAWVVQGLADGRLVVLIKFSHAITDGVGAVTSMLPELMTVDADAEFAVAPERAEATMPGAATRVWDVIDEIAANTAVGIRIAVRLGPVAVKSTIGTALRSVRQLLPGAGPQRSDGSGFRGGRQFAANAAERPLTARRTVAFAGVAMDDVRAIAAAFDVTVNDVFDRNDIGAAQMVGKPRHGAQSSAAHHDADLDTRRRRRRVQ